MTKRTKKRRYTEAFIASSVLMWEATPNYVQVSSRLGIPESTLRSWVNRALKPTKMPQGKEAPIEVYDMKKEEMTSSVSKLLGLHFVEAENTIAGASHHEIIGGVKILFDVYQLLTGGATANANQQVLIKYAD